MIMRDISSERNIAHVIGLVTDFRVIEGRFTIHAMSIIIIRCVCARVELVVVAVVVGRVEFNEN